MHLAVLVRVVECRIEAVGVEDGVALRFVRLAHRLLERQLVAVTGAPLDPVVAVVANRDDQMRRSHVGGAPGDAVHEPRLRGDRTSVGLARVLVVGHQHEPIRALPEPLVVEGLIVEGHGLG